MVERRSSGNCPGPASANTLPASFAVEISRRAAGEFFSALAVHGLEADLEAVKKSPLFG
jgi:hypothetical protein